MYYRDNLVYIVEILCIISISVFIVLAPISIY